jgi:hypothetical protein
MSDQLVVYVRLLDEGTVSASCDSEGAYRLTGKQDPGERWEFGPGSLVRCAPKTFSDGTSGLAVTGRAARGL